MSPLLAYGVLLLPAALLAYYLLTWLLVGRNPKPGAIVAQYAPPGNLSPAEARYVLTGTIDYKSTAAVLAHLAAQKIISIKPESDGYRVTRLTDELPPTFPAEEGAAFRAMLEVETFSNPADKNNAANPKSFLLRPGHNDNKISLITSVVAGAVTKRVQGLYFDGNLRYSLPAVAVSLGLALVMAFQFPSRDGIVFETLWFLLCGFLISLIVTATFAPALRDALRGRLSLRQMAISVVPLSLFVGALVFVDTKISKGSNPAFAGMLIALVALNATFIAALRKLTVTGRQRTDELLGFRQFLETVELDRFNRLNNPQITPALLNDYLAYAIAFDLKEAWGDHLSSALFGATTTTAN
jgi:hypothetical protein